MAEGPRLTPVYIGLGANLGKPRETIRKAIADIGDLDNVWPALSSSYYSSAPMGPQDQPSYTNAVVAVLTAEPPQVLLRKLQKIEQDYGRKRAGERWGPRTLDLDILVFGREQHDEPGLSVPHPGLAERNFVLYPLAEIAPRLRIPGLGIAEDLAGTVGPEGLVKLE